MADYEQYNSTNDEYQFSKGPKSLYFAQGDEDLLGVILNVPQTDVDDEWGGTERIAWERTVDEIGTLQEYVYDPAGGGTNGLVHKMDQLVGTSGLFDLTMPSLTLGTITINGLTNAITFGTAGSISATSLTLDTHFTLVTASGYARLTYQANSTNGSRITIADTIYGSLVNISTNAATLQLTDTALTVTSGLALSGVGALSVTTINASSTATVGGLAATGTIALNGAISITGNPPGTFSITGNPLFTDSPYFSTKLLPSGSSIDIGASPSERFGTLYCENINNSVNLTVTGNATVGNLIRGSGSSNIGAGPTPFNTIYALNAYIMDPFGSTYQLSANSTLIVIKAPSISVQGPVDFSSALSTSLSVNIGSGTDRFGTLYCSAIDTSANVTVGGVLNVSGSVTVTNAISTLIGNITSGMDLISNGDIYSAAFQIFSIVSFTNISASPSTKVYYKLVGKRAFIEVYLDGTTTTGAFILMTLPYAVHSGTNYRFVFPCKVSLDGGSTYQSTPGSMIGVASGGSINIYSNYSTGTFGASTPVIIYGNFNYEIA